MNVLTWNRAVLAPSLIATALTAVLLVSTPEASAYGGAVARLEQAPLAPPCERRTASHLAEHGGQYTDDRYHVARGELPACDDASDRSGSDHNDGDGNGSDDGGFNRHRDRIKPSWRDLF